MTGPRRLPNALRAALTAAALTAGAATSPIATRSSTKTGTPSVSSPTQTPSTSPVPSLSPELWGLYDTSVPSPTLQPITLYRSSIDQRLYAQLNKTAPPGAPMDAVVVWDAWQNGSPYPNVATQGTNDPTVVYPPGACGPRPVRPARLRAVLVLRPIGAFPARRRRPLPLRSGAVQATGDPSRAS